MRAPESEELRPGDFVKVRGTTNPAHHGGRAVVVAVHRQPGPPWRVVSLDVRYSARGGALRVDLGERGELVRWDTPWQPEHTVEDEPHELLTPGVAEASAPVSRRKLAVGALVVLLPLTALGIWEHQRPAVDPNPVVVQRALQEGARGTTSSTATPITTPSATTRAATTETVVAWAAGPVPVVAGADGTNPTPLAGIVPAEGCRDAYVRDLMSYLPMGQGVDVAGAGWYRTDDGIDVNAELVRTGVAVPDPATAGSSASDTANLASVQDLATKAPHDCS